MHCEDFIVLFNREYNKLRTTAINVIRYITVFNFVINVI